MTEKSLPEESIFLRALDIASSEEREAYLDQACGQNVNLRAEVKALLHANQKSGDLLDLPESPATIDQPITGKPGTQIGPYKLLEQISEGGMGVVYVAEQTEPVKRKVALKIIKPGMASQDVITRFEAERQALALMDHPNIARVYDGGVTETGQPYFVMELVQGLPITEYCDSYQLDTRDRLHLFQIVCRAVQHAHQRGIIHRDLKPSNILISRIDGQAVPKVIDFGVAKAVKHRLAEKTVYTQFAQLIGTPLYMSPEQAELGVIDIDTRSDVYSLGILLYELLTGTTPFDRETLKQASFDEMRRIIREDEPLRPSDKLDTLNAEALSTVSKQRHSDPRRLHDVLYGELDWIAMKAMEKDRIRRYETANELAADVQRFLADEPVIAGPPSASYRFRKFAKRNRTLLITAAVVASVLVLATIVSTSLAIWALNAEKRASVQAVAEKEQRRKADSEATKSSQIAAFLQGMLDRVGPSVALGRDTELLKEILDETAERIDTELQNQPEVESDLRSTLGAVYFDLGDYPAAERMHGKALEIRRNLFPGAHQKRLDSLQALGETANFQHKVKEADVLLHEALAMAKTLFGDQHAEIGCTLRLLGETTNTQGHFAEAEELLRQALAIYQKTMAGDHEEIATTIHKIGHTQMNQKQYDQAEQSFRQALEMRIRLQDADHPDVAMIRNDLAVALSAQKKHEEMFAEYRHALGICQRVLGDLHPNTILLQRNLGYEMMLHGDQEEGMQWAKKAYENSKFVKGKTMELSPVNITYAMMLDRQGKRDEAEEITVESLASLRKALGPDSPFLFDYLDETGFLFWGHGKLEEAETHFRDALRIGRMHNEESDGDVNRVFWKLCNVLHQKHRLAEVETICRDRLTRLTAEKAFDAEKPIAAHLSFVLRKQGKFEQAIQFCQDRLAECRNRSDDETDSKTAMEHHALMELSRAWQDSGDIDQAITCCREILSGDGKTADAETASRSSTAMRLANLLDKAGKLDEAYDVLEQEMQYAAVNLTNAEWCLVALLFAGRNDQHQAFGERILASAEQTSDVGEAERALRTLLINPSIDSSLVARAKALAVRHADPHDGKQLAPWSQLCLGLAAYRQENYEEADRALQLAIQSDEKDCQLIARIFLATSAFRQDSLDDARRLLAESQPDLGLLAVLELRSPFGLDSAKLAAWLAVREAKSVMGEDPFAQRPSALSTLRLASAIGRGDMESVCRIALSTDGRHLYTSAFRTNAIGAFLIEGPTEHLVHLQSHQRIYPHGRPFGVQVDPSGKMVAAACAESRSVVLFRRDPASGLLKVADVFQSMPEDEHSLKKPMELAFSPDSRFLYVIDAGNVWTEGRGSGVMTLSIENGATLRWVDTNYGKSVCFANARGIAVHPNRRWLYVASSDANTLVLCKLDEQTGASTTEQILRDEIDGVHCLAGAMRVACSPDGRFVYTSSGRFRGDNAVGVFRVGDDGRLTVVQELHAGDDGIGDFAGGNEVAVSPDGQFVVACGTTSSTLACFARDADSGELTHIETTPVGGMPAGLCFSPDSKRIYVALEGESCVAVWHLQDSVSSATRFDNDLERSSGLLVGRDKRARFRTIQTQNDRELQVTHSR